MASPASASRATFHDQLDDHLGVLAESGGGSLQDRVVGLDVAVAVHHGVAPAVHLEALFGIQAHQLADDDEWHMDGEVLHEVDLTSFADGVDRLVGQVADMRDQRTDLARCEALVDEPPLAEVLVAVEGDERHVTGDLRAHTLAVAVALVVARDVEHVLVAGRYVEVVGLVVVERLEVAEPLVHVPRVVVDLGVGEVDVGVVLLGLCLSHVSIPRRIMWRTDVASFPNRVGPD